MKDLQNEVNELLKNAMEQPGVAEVTRLYESQKAAIDAHSIAKQVVAPRWIAFSSTSSSPRTN